MLLLVVLVVAGCGDLLLEIVDGAAGFGHEAAHVLGHLRQRARAEDHEEDEPDYHHLLRPHAEHTTEYNPRTRTIQTAATRSPWQRIYSSHVHERESLPMISWGAARTIAVTLASR